MTFFLQMPPTGTYAMAIIEGKDESWIYDINSQWRPVPEVWDSVSWMGDAAIMFHGLCVTELSTALPVDTVRVLKEIIEQRPSGCIGMYTRGLDRLPEAGGGIVYAMDFGMLWHPDPEALSRCRAHERWPSNYPGADGSHVWKRYDTFAEMFRAVPVRGKSA